jgi:hypothetical protein
MPESALACRTNSPARHPFPFDRHDGSASNTTPPTSDAILQIEHPVARFQAKTNAIRVAKILTDEVEEDMGDSGKDKTAQALGKKGGRSRAEKMSPERRREIARQAAARRWVRTSE